MSRVCSYISMQLNVVAMLRYIYTYDMIFITMFTIKLNLFIAAVPLKNSGCASAHFCGLFYEDEQKTFGIRLRSYTIKN